MIFCKDLVNYERVKVKDSGKQNKKNPLYKQIYQCLKDDIKSGIYKINERIMSEPQISVFYNVSRITARNALEALERDGYIYRIRGKGSFVCWKQPNEQSIANKGSVPSKWVNFFHDNTVLSKLKLISVSPRLKKYYDVPDEMLGSTFKMDRYSGKTVTYYSYFPLLTELDIKQYSSSQSIRSIYQKNGFHPMRFVQRLCAATSDDIIAEKYHVPVNAVVLLDIVAFYNDQNQLMDLTVGCYEDSDSILTVKMK